MHQPLVCTATQTSSGAGTAIVPKKPRPIMAGSAIGAEKRFRHSAAPRGGYYAGIAQLVERQPSKLDVAGSNPVSRSRRRTGPPAGWLSMRTLLSVGKRLAIQRGAFPVISSVVVIAILVCEGGMAMAEISCKHCGSLDCRGCNLYRLEQMLDAGKFDPLMNENRAIQISADVAPVVHGRWTNMCEFAPLWKCSVCGKHTKNTAPAYCPHCGAKTEVQDA